MKKSTNISINIRRSIPPTITAMKLANTATVMIRPKKMVNMAMEISRSMNMVKMGSMTISMVMARVTALVHLIKLRNKPGLEKNSSNTWLKN